MVHMSEYDRAFKAQLKCRSKTYGDNFDYRMQRRNTECRHSVDPFVWDLEEWDDVLESERSSVETPCNNVGSRPASVPLHKYKHHLFNEMYKAKLEKEQAAMAQRRQLQEQQAALAKQRHQYVIESSKNQPLVTGAGGVEDNPRKTTQNSSERGRKQPDVHQARTAEKTKKSKKLPAKISRKKGRVRVSSGVQTDLFHKCSRQVQTPDWEELHLDIQDDTESESEYIDSGNEEKNGIPRSVSTASTDPSTPVSSQKEKTKETPPKGVREKKPHIEVKKPVERPRKPQIKKPLPQAARPRPKSAPSGHPVRLMQHPKPVQLQQPPFLPYGFKDKERETGVKKTYNVRASNDVYPSALRALRVREGMRHSNEEPVAALYRAFRNEVAFDHDMNQETAKWDTEYRSHYPVYEASEYRRNVMHRLQPRKPRAFFYCAGQA